MRSAVKEVSPVMQELEVEVPWETVKESVDLGFRELGKYAKVRGFRQGKVPPTMVRKLFRSQVHDETRRDLVEQGLVAAVREHGIQLLARPKVDMPDIEEGKAFRFTALVEVRPRVGPVPLDDLEVEIPVMEVTQAEVDAELETLRKNYAEIRELEKPRPARDGDQVEVNYTVMVDGEVKAELAQQGRRFVVGDESIQREMSEGVVGMSPGDTRDVTVHFKGGESDESPSKSAVFSVTMVAVRERLLPELDDEFAKDVSGDHETLLELKVQLRKDLEASDNEDREVLIKDGVVDVLLSRHGIMAPPSMVQEETRRLIMQMVSIGRSRGLDMRPTEEDVGNMAQRAERRVRAALLLRAIAEQEQVEVSEEDVDRELEIMSERTGRSLAQVRAELQQVDDGRERLIEDLRHSRLMDMLVSKTKVTEVSSDEEKGRDDT